MESRPETIRFKCQPLHSEVLLPHYTPSAGRSLSYRKILEGWGPFLSPDLKQEGAHGNPYIQRCCYHTTPPKILEGWGPFLSWPHPSLMYSTNVDKLEACIYIPKRSNANIPLHNLSIIIKGICESRSETKICTWKAMYVCMYICAWIRYCLFTKDLLGYPHI